MGSSGLCFVDAGQSTVGITLEENTSAPQSTEFLDRCCLYGANPDGHSPGIGCCIYSNFSYFRYGASIRVKTVS